METKSNSCVLIKSLGDDRIHVTASQLRGSTTTETGIKLYELSKDIKDQLGGFDFINPLSSGVTAFILLKFINLIVGMKLLIYQI